MACDKSQVVFDLFPVTGKDMKMAFEVFPVTGNYFEAASDKLKMTLQRFKVIFDLSFVIFWGWHASGSLSLAATTFIQRCRKAASPPPRERFRP
jgi:hypothetical protein